MRKPTWRLYTLLFLSAFALRAAVFYFYIQHEERYCQPDSVDYHNCGLCVAYGFGMSHPSGKPIFWRTPGYPCFLAPFLKTFSMSPAGVFSTYGAAHKGAIWVQIFLCSLLPLLMLWLAYIVTQSYAIASICAWISVVHVGFVLASTYLLTDGLAMLFFIIFLGMIFRSLRIYHENYSYWQVIAAAIALGAYTWMRPMGQFVAILATVLLLCMKDTWRNKIFKATLFLGVFAVTLCPWILRNTYLTGTAFFCPLAGLYFNVFNAPKILARVENIPLEVAHQKLMCAAAYEQLTVLAERKKSGDTRHLCGETLCMKTAWPVIAAHPFYFIRDWIVEVCKTTFDLYSYQLVALVQNCFKWDPLIEYLDEKISSCLYAKPLPFVARMISWLEFLGNILIWVGIVAGVWFFVINKKVRSYAQVWVFAGIIICCVLFQTGGFGYARLRLPIEPLMLILCVTFWYWRIGFNTCSRKS